MIKKTPAVTIVAACKRAETGVGPSIASGSQVCKNNWADFAKAAINIRNEIRSITRTVVVNKKIVV